MFSKTNFQIRGKFGNFSSVYNSLVFLFPKFSLSFCCFLVLFPYFKWKKYMIFPDYWTDFWQKNVTLWTFLSIRIFKAWNKVYINNCNVIWQQFLKTDSKIGFCLVKVIVLWPNYEPHNVVVSTSWTEDFSWVFLECYDLPRHFPEFSSFSLKAKNPARIYLCLITRRVFVMDLRELFIRTKVQS